MPRDDREEESGSLSACLTDGTQCEKWAWIFGICGVLLISAAGAIWWKLSKRKKEKQQEEALAVRKQLEAKEPAFKKEWKEYEEKAMEKKRQYEELRQKINHLESFKS